MLHSLSDLSSNVPNSLGPLQQHKLLFLLLNVIILTESILEKNFMVQTDFSQ